MRKLFARLWNDDCGALIAMEFLFVATILVIGTIVGLTDVRNAINTELGELANAILALSEGFTLSGQSGCGAQTDGSQTNIVTTNVRIRVGRVHGGAGVTIAKVPIVAGRPAAQVGEIDTQRREAVGRASYKVCHDRRRWIGHHDVVGPDYCIGAVGTNGLQTDRVTAGVAVGVGRIDQRAGVSITEVPTVT